MSQARVRPSCSAAPAFPLPLDFLVLTLSTVVLTAIAARLYPRLAQ